MTDLPKLPLNPHLRMESAWFRAWHRSLYTAYHAAFTLGFSLRMTGERNMTQAGPALVVANHQSFLDPLIIGLAARRPLVYLARKTLFRNRFFAAMIRSLNAVPIDQEGVGKEGIRTVLEQLQCGNAVVVFPEGERTLGQMIPLRPGIHLLIKRTHVPIVPIGIAGAAEAWPRTRAYPWPAPLFLPARPGTIAVSIGAPIDARRLAELPRQEALAKLFDLIHAQKDIAEKLRRR
ncbi:MAG: 1-acyl-sn-glycerol-3-phosphate acyltransferase [Planctomycetes bacterium]|nr:1-acyl-sn-glycerol-3-phosphate acyltransferase [Planctomycetota bacterium]